MASAVVSEGTAVVSEALAVALEAMAVALEATAVVSAVDTEGITDINNNMS